MRRFGVGEVLLVTSLAFAGASCTNSREALPGATTVPVESTLPDLVLGTTTALLPVETTVAPPVAEAVATSTTLSAVVLKAANPNCVTEILPNDNYIKIAKRVSVTAQQLQDENSIEPTKLIAGKTLDFCIGNGIDDYTGQERTPATSTTIEPATTTVAPEPETTLPTATVPETTLDTTPATVPVETTPATTANLPTGDLARQMRLNAVLEPLGMPHLTEDGIEGPRTLQAECAAEWLFGLEESTAPVEDGSDAEIAILTGAITLPPDPFANSPEGAYTNRDHWVFVNQTCQVLIYGSKDQLVAVNPTSTGKEFTPTDNDSYDASRYDPAVANNGWHNSADFPVEADNPLDGNMYKPVYFEDDKKAIHGALDVPPQPASHGCVRMIVANMDKFISWLGLDGVTEQTYSKKLINLKVLIKGTWTGAK